MCAYSEGSGEIARMRRLAWAFAGRLCDKYHNLMSWLIVKEKERLLFIIFMISPIAVCLCEETKCFLTFIEMPAFNVGSLM